ncbi:MAG TPA: hypothetical protein VMU75_01480 [Acidimicrobiales bacterium]|nr:hypothetical protein [Acidimicrobiales bacterium]
MAIHGPAAAWVTNEIVLEGRANDLWTLSWPPASGESLACGSAAVLRIDSRTGRASVAARLPAPTVDQYDGCNGLEPGEAVVASGRPFVLEGRSSLGTNYGYAKLYAITLPLAAR